MSGADRNLLLGILALQLEIINRNQLLAAFQSWVVERTRTLESILVEQRAITEKQARFVVDLSEKYVDLFDKDVQRSIAGLSDITSVVAKLEELGDEEIEKTILMTAALRKEQRDAEDSAGLEATCSYESNKSTSRFRILRPHAKGGLGQVSVAEDTELHREVALKEIQPQFASDSFSQGRFILEAEITGNLEHPGIVPVYSLGKSSDGQPFYVMRFIHGNSLKEAINALHRSGKQLTQREYQLAVRKLLRRFVDVCNAIEYAHSRGVLHRDLKPGNIMLGKYGETLVVDWGLAKTIGKSEKYADVEEPTFAPGSKEGSTHTRMGSLVGTLAYMSPEQAEGRLDLMGPTTDVYCLGGTLYSILTGKTPIDRDKQEIMLAKIRAGEIVPPRECNPNVPLALAAICMKALSLKQADRYSTASVLADEIELWLADEPVAAFREPLLQRGARWVRRHRALSTGAAVALTVSLLSMMVILTLISKQNYDLRIARDEEARQRNKAEAAQKLEREQRDRLAQVALKILDFAESDLASIPQAALFRTHVMDFSYDQSLLLMDYPDVSEDMKKVFVKSARFSGNQQGRIKNFAEGIKRNQDSIKVQEDLLRTSPTDSSKDFLGESYRDLAALQRNLGNISDATKSAERAIAIATEMLKDSPENVDYQRSLAVAEFTRAGIEAELANYAASAALARKAFDTLNRFASNDKATRVDISLALSAGSLFCRMLAEIEDFERSKQAFAEVIELIDRLGTKINDDITAKMTVARILASSTEAELEAKQVTDVSLERLQRSLKMYESPEVARSSTFMSFHAEALRTQARYFAFQKNLDAAKSQYQLARALAEKVREQGNLPENDVSLALLLSEESDVLEATGSPTEARATRQRAVELLENAIKMRPEKRMYQEELLEVQKKLN